MRRLIYRTTAVVLSATLGLALIATPCIAAENTGKKADSKLTRLSAESRALLAARVSPKLRGSGADGLRSESGQSTQPPSNSSSFFKSTRGKVTLALMAAGTGLTIWSISHDRKPVKSPVR